MKGLLVNQHFLMATAFETLSEVAVTGKKTEEPILTSQLPEVGARQGLDQRMG